MRFWKFGLLLCGLWFLAGVTSGCGVAPGSVCTYEGKSYADGASFPDTDGCNTCTCSGGSVSCTEKACVSACSYNGKSYKDGDQFPASDGCNSCMCRNGQVMCTLAVCPKDCLYKGKTYKDGTTFAAEDGCNTCSCSAGGVSCTEKTCKEKSCGGLVPPGVDNSCPSGQYCHYDIELMCGATDATGVCRVLPTACPEYYAPVCACNGKTYTNECAANAAGTSAMKIGECAKPTTCSYNGKVYKEGETFTDANGCNACVCSGGQVACTDRACPPKSCGGLTNLACADGMYCKIEQGCGFDDGMGICVAKPSGCNLVYQPVCGCDGKTYGNACEAARNGASIAKEGECESEPSMCKYDGMRYKDGEKFPATDGCNTCVCSGGRVSCTETDCAMKRCGGLVPPGVDNSCPAGQYCHFSVTAMCGAADMPGVCAVKPQGCGREYNPVCGCDGKTYANYCEAAMAGTSAMSSGACR